MPATLSFVAHQDDDLLFMNPDAASDAQAGTQTWICYLTAGNLVNGADGMPYADQRIQGARAAWARAAKVADDWEFEPITLSNGRQLATNYLTAAPHVRLVFTFINAANGPDNGDLCRMWADPAFQAAPIDGRPAYTKTQFIATLKALIATVAPDFIRVPDVWGWPDMQDHIDHGYAAQFAMSANITTGSKVVRRADSYFGYIVQSMPDNVAGYWQTEKQAIWDAYKPYDPQLNWGSWNNVMTKQHRRQILWPGDTWQPHVS